MTLRFSSSPITREIQTIRSVIRSPIVALLFWTLSAARLVQQAQLPQRCSLSAATVFPWSNKLSCRCFLGCRFFGTPLTPPPERFKIIAFENRRRFWGPFWPFELFWVHLYLKFCFKKSSFSSDYDENASAFEGFRTTRWTQNFTSAQLKPSSKHFWYFALFWHPPPPWSPSGD